MIDFFIKQQKILFKDSIFAIFRNFNLNTDLKFEQIKIITPKKSK